MLSIEYILVIPFIFLLYIFIIPFKKPKNFPPGPVGIPVLGSLFYAFPNFNESLPRLAKQYGNIFSLKLVEKNIVCLVGYDLIREVMVDRPKDFPSRPITLQAQIARRENLNGIATAPYGPKWAAQRKFYFTAMRNMGLNKQGISTCISNELAYFCEELQKLKSSEAVNPCSVIDYATLNVLAYFVFGNRYSCGDAKFKQLMDLNNEFFQKLAMLFARDKALFIFHLFPGLRRIWLPQSAKKLRKNVGQIRDFIKSEISYHRDTIDPNHPRDLIDYYLKELNAGREHFSVTALELNVLDFFQAGTETTATTLRWAIVYMANNPEIQKKVQDEIDRVLGEDKLPSYSDRLAMPYCEATIMEVQRKANIGAVGLAHETIENVKLAGYNIPKGTTILACYHSIHYSSEHWKNPNRFDPENFLDPDGKVGTRNAFMPFGGGVRICLGMNLAKQELFIFFVGMLQKFTIRPPDGVKFISEDPIIGATATPKPFKVIIESRA